jgi:hypothetical protein
MRETDLQVFERNIRTSEYVNETVKCLRGKNGTTPYLGNAVEVSVMKVTQSWVWDGDIVSAVTRDGVI